MKASKNAPIGWALAALVVMLATSTSSFGGSRPPSPTTGDAINTTIDATPIAPLAADEGPSQNDRFNCFLSCLKWGYPWDFCRDECYNPNPPPDYPVPFPYPTTTTP